MANSLFGCNNYKEAFRNVMNFEWLCQSLWWIYGFNFELKKLQHIKMYANLNVICLLKDVKGRRCADEWNEYVWQKLHESFARFGSIILNAVGMTFTFTLSRTKSLSEECFLVFFIKQKLTRTFSFALIYYLIIYAFVSLVFGTNLPH